MTKVPSKQLQAAKYLEEIKQTRNWNLLDKFSSKTTVDQLSAPEKEDLASLFCEKGTGLLNESEGSTNLEEAIAAFKMAMKCDPANGRIWSSLGEAYLKMGVFKENDSMLSKAHYHFDHAYAIFRIQQKKMPLETLWDWGTCLYSMAKQSEEAFDFRRAIEKYEEAYERGFRHPEFLISYGTAMGELGVLVGRQEILVKASDLLETSLKENDKGSQDKYAIGWLRHACLNKILFFTTADSAYYEKADQSFFAAAKHGDLSLSLWLNWGQMILLEAKALRDVEVLKIALERIEQAEKIKPNEPLVLLNKADALMHIGIFDESYESLKESQKILLALKKSDPKNTEVICLLGDCYTQIGTYFTDSSYLKKAVDEYKLGVEIDPQAFNIWHGLAHVHYLLGEMEKDFTYFEKSAQYCAETIKQGGLSPSFWNDWGMALMRYGEETDDAVFLKAAVEKFEEAINTFFRHAKGAPEPHWIYNYGCALDILGELEGDTHNYERAIAVLSKLLEQYPDGNHIRQRLALACYHLGDELGDIDILELALENFMALVASDPEDGLFYNDMAVTCLTIASLLQESLSPQKADEYFNQAEPLLFKALSLGEEVTNFYLACHYALKENFTEAMHYMERAKATGSLPPLDILLRDDWLESLRQTAKFRAFLSMLAEEEKP